MKNFIIPDIVLFINGLPVVVVECKDLNANESNPMAEAFKQLMRYSEQRAETKKAGLKEGEPRLFHTNQFIVRTSGDICQFGTVTSTDEEFFYPWPNIYPVKYKTYNPPLENERQQETLIQGMLPKERRCQISSNAKTGCATMVRGWICRLLFLIRCLAHWIRKCISNEGTGYPIGP